MLERWEVKAIRADQVQIKEPYVVVRTAKSGSGMHITPCLKHRRTFIPTRYVRGSSCCCARSPNSSVKVRRAGIPWFR